MGDHSPVVGQQSGGVGRETDSREIQNIGSWRTLRRHMQEEAAQELRCGECHAPLFAAARLIFPAEGDTLAVKGQQPVIGDGNSMRVSAEVAEDLQPAAKSGFGVHDPVLAM